MQIPSAHTMKESLGQLLLEMNGARHQYNAGVYQMRKYNICDVGNAVDFFNAFKETVSEYFQNTIKALNACHAPAGPEYIQCPTSYWMFNKRADFARSDDPQNGIPFEHKRKLADANTQSLEEQNTLILAAVNEIRFNEIEKSLTASLVSLNGRELASLANAVFSDLNLSIDRRYRETVFKGGAVICPIRAASNYRQRERVEEIDRLEQALAKIAEHANLTLGYALSELKDDLCKLNFEHSIASRTAYKYPSLTVRCFKEKYQLEFSCAFFEAIAAFILLYADDEKANSIHHLLNQMSAAA